MVGDTCYLPQLDFVTPAVLCCILHKVHICMHACCVVCVCVATGPALRYLLCVAIPSTWALLHRMCICLAHMGRAKPAVQRGY